jgi:hypothetical protein
LQRRAVRQSDPEEVPPIVHEVLRTPGQPLDNETRKFMEPRFGQDFSRVRVHTDAQAARSARAANAHAYTIGNDLVFGAGEYSPETARGRKLLAHELAHTMQQSSERNCVSFSELGISTPKDASEQEADRIARSITSNETISPLLAYTSGSILQCESFGDFLGGLNPQCSIDWQAVWERRFDLGKHLNCCANLPVAGNTCSADVIEAIRKILGGGGVRPSVPPLPRPNCPGRETPFGTCCPTGQSWNGTSCSRRSTFPPIQLCLPPERPTIFGGCCLPGQTVDRQGRPCGFIPTPPQPQPPQPQPPSPLPSAVEIFFQKDRPRQGETGSSSLRSSATSEGFTNFAGLVAQLIANPDLQVQLVGRASPEGREEYNMEVGARRANVVAEALVDAGISASRIADPPISELRSECRPLRPGVFTCGEAGATDPSDRQVLARVFSSRRP